MSCSRCSLPQSSDATKRSLRHTLHRVPKSGVTVETLERPPRERERERERDYARVCFKKRKKRQERYFRRALAPDGRFSRQRI